MGWLQNVGHFAGNALGHVAPSVSIHGKKINLNPAGFLANTASAGLKGDDIGAAARDQGGAQLRGAALAAAGAAGSAMLPGAAGAGATGAGTAGAAGTVGTGVASAAPTGGFLSTIGGFLGKHKNDILDYGQAAEGVYDKYRSVQDYNKRAPLREAGMRGLLDTSTPDTSAVFADPTAPTKYRSVSVGSRGRV